MTNFATGHDAEKVAAEYLRNEDYKVLDLNWRTKYCEIDIVAEKNKTVYFIEVKYRKSISFGGGLEYITAKKLKQMSFAASMWVNDHNWLGDYQLSALELSGPNFQITEFLRDL